MVLALLVLLPVLKSNSFQYPEVVHSEKAWLLWALRPKRNVLSESPWRRRHVIFCFFLLPQKTLCRASGWGRRDPKHLAQPPRRTTSTETPGRAKVAAAVAEEEMPPVPATPFHGLLRLGANSGVGARGCKGGGLEPPVCKQ